MTSFSREAVSKPKILVLYHYMFPDDVVSARHFDGFCEELVQRGWNVEAWPCNRACRMESLTYPRRSEWNGIRFRRIWRPAFRQSSSVGRILNSLWMLSRWAVRLSFTSSAPAVVVVGTDPAMSVLLALLVRRFKLTKIVHWCFDLYPEVAVADGLLPEASLRVSTLRALLRRAYGCCDLIADLGPCMRARLDAYGHRATTRTLVPWALSEPASPLSANPATKAALFGAGECLGLLYSGNFGRAHSYEILLALALEIQQDNIRFCFSVRGNRESELRSAVERSEVASIRTAPFVNESDLLERLGAADIHLVSLHESWTGVVVPSKFFGALAAGRPVLFAGSPESAIARWIEEFQVGWILTPGSLPQVARQLRELSTDRDRLHRLQRHCHSIYQDHFSKSKTMDSWDILLRRAIGDPVSAPLEPASVP